jgi:hypothetical protein
MDFELTFERGDRSSPMAVLTLISLGRGAKDRT